MQVQVVLDQHQADNIEEAVLWPHEAGRVSLLPGRTRRAMQRRGMCHASSVRGSRRILPDISPGARVLLQ
jgi:hypothetical protein